MEEIQNDATEVVVKDGEQGEDTNVAQTEVTEETSDSSSEADFDWKKEALKWKGIAKKAKDKIDSLKVKPEEQEVTKQPDQLSQADVIALARSKVEDEDMQEVLDFAKFKNIPVAEALKNSTLQTILKERDEVRESAKVARDGKSKRAATELSDEAIVEMARKGTLPDDKYDRLAQAEMNLRKKKAR